MERRRRRPDRRAERVEGNAFMDTARPAFIRWVALEKWREIEDLRTTHGLDLARAIEAAAEFPNRGRYQGLWVARWRAEVRPETTGAEPGRVFAAIERAVAEALREEEAQRKSQGDPPLEEDAEYKAFVDGALETLLRSQAGQLEPS